MLMWRKGALQGTFDVSDAGDMSSAAAASAS